MRVKYSQHLSNRIQNFKTDFPENYNSLHKALDTISFELLLIRIYPNTPRKDIFQPSKEILQQFDKDNK